MIIRIAPLLDGTNGRGDCFVCQIMIALFFNRLDISELVVSPAYEPKGRLVSQRTKGFLRLGGKPLTFTGPRLRVVYGGCRWNRIVLSDDNPEFHDFIFRLSDLVKSIVWSDPEKYRHGSKSNNRFLLETNFFKVSGDPEQYPDEWRFKLDTRKEWKKNDETGKMEIEREWVVTELRDVEGNAVDPSSVQRNGHIVPIIQATYSRDNEKFGVVLTVLQGLYYPPEQTEEESWQMDLSEN